MNPQSGHRTCGPAPALPGLLFATGRCVGLPGPAHLVQDLAEVVQTGGVQRQHLLDGGQADAVGLGVGGRLTGPRCCDLLRAAVVHGLGQQDIVG